MTTTTARTVWGLPDASGASSEEQFWGLRILIVAVTISLGGVFLGFKTGVALLASLGFLLTLIGVVNPTIGLFGVGILCVIDSVTRVLLMTGGLLRYNTFNYVLLLVLLLCFTKVQTMTDKQTRILIGLLALMVLGLVISPDVATGAFGILNVTAELGLLLYFLRARDKGNSLYWMALINAVIAPLQCVVFFLQMSSLRRINPNSWAYMPLTAIMSICLVYGSVKVKRDRMLLLGLAVANCAGVFLSASRGSMLVAAICVLYLIYETRSTSLRFAFLGGGLGLMVVAASLFPEMQQYALRRIGKTFDDRYSMGGRTSGRSELVEAGVKMFVENPFGRGSGAFSVELQDIQGFSKQSHSGWVKTAVENGVVGVVMLGAFIGSFAWVGLRNRRVHRMAGLGVMVTAAITVALFSTEFNAKGLWFLMAGATAILSYPPKRKRIRIPDEPQIRSSYEGRTAIAAGQGVYGQPGLSGAQW